MPRLLLIPSEFASRMLPVAIVCWLTGVSPLIAADHYVSPNGSAKGDGTSEAPWDLATALGHPKTVRPGDTIRLRGGTYSGGFTSRLTGTAEAPIVVRQARGERAIIDCLTTDNTRPALFNVEGAHVRFQDLEFTCSEPRRATSQTGSWPTDLHRGGIHCRASHVSFVNLVLHDLATGIGFWAEGEGGEIYGCLIYHNGWRAPDRGHGHGIYTQNVRGVKRLVDNVIFNQFGHGVQAYGSSKAALRGYHIEGNAIFNNGVLASPESRSTNLLVGGDQRAENIVALNNYCYHSTLGHTTAQFGYSVCSDDLKLRGNVFAGFLRLIPWERLTVEDNTFVGKSSLLELHVPERAATSRYAFDRNAYYFEEDRYAPLMVMLDGKPLAHGWSAWREQAALDPAGTYTKGRPRGALVAVRPNQYDPGRANVIVFNWDRSPAVELDLKEVLKVGQGYRIVSAQNIFGESLVQGTFEGKPVQLPMRAVPPATPIGMADAQLPRTEPEFGAYVVLPEGN